MQIAFFCLSLMLLLSCEIQFSTSKRRAVVKTFVKPRNNLQHEKALIKVFNKTVIPFALYELKPIAPNVFKLNVTIKLAKPINSLWAEFTLYYKYKTYQRYLVHLKEDICAFLEGSETFPIVKLLIESILRLDVQFNVPLKCPFPDLFIATSDAYNMSAFNSPLMPAGRYRLDTAFTIEKNGRTEFIIEEYFSISDLRVWF